MRLLGSPPSRVAVIQMARAENGEAGLQGASRCRQGSVEGSTRRKVLSQPVGSEGSHDYDTRVPMFPLYTANQGVGPYTGKQRHLFISKTIYSVRQWERWEQKSQWGRSLRDPIVV
jgi:hypothetical protein